MKTAMADMALPIEEYKSNSNDPKAFHSGGGDLRDDVATGQRQYNNSENIKVND